MVNVYKLYIKGRRAPIQSTSLVVIIDVADRYSKRGESWGLYVDGKCVMTGLDYKE